MNHSDGGDHFVFHDRSQRRSKDGTVVHMAEAADTFHCVPAGTYAPDRDYFGYPEDRTVSRTFWREFAGELLGKSEVRDIIKNHDNFMMDGTLAPFIQAMCDGNLQLFLAGIGFDPLLLKPEILLFCVINCEAFPEPKFDSQFLTANLEEGTPFFRSWSVESLKLQAGMAKTLPAGEAVLRLAIERFHDIDQLFGRKRDHQ